MEIPEKIRLLMNRGVTVHNPLTVYIGDDVDPDRISVDNVVIWGGARIRGKKTLISSGARLGEEGPVTLADCRLGRDVALKAGYFRESVFLDRASMGSGAQVREGCLLEEEANGAHTVGLKQTILFPFVTLGSLVNLCDCLMAGGTSRRDHSEVGSSYIHFNFTPNQDKATASLIGDVPRGVMLRERPIFLGGQGGIVGPLRIGYGTVVAAGTILREDLDDGCLFSGYGKNEGSAKPFHEGLYGNPARIIANNIEYVANIIALLSWYRHVRRHFFHGLDFGAALYEGAMETLSLALSERIKRLGDLAEKMGRSAENTDRIISRGDHFPLVESQKKFNRAWPRLREFLAATEAESPAEKERIDFIKELEGSSGKDYIEAICNLDKKTKDLGTAWLSATVKGIRDKALEILEA